jgi:hypothetical protein
MKVTLSSISTWKSKGLDPDGADYGSKAEAEAAEFRRAHDGAGRLQPDYDGTDDIADAITEHPRADEVSETAWPQSARARDLTDDEALIAAEDYAATTRGLSDHRRASPAVLEDADDLRQALETALTGVAGLLANWERGDLAGQVHALQGWAEGTPSRSSPTSTPSAGSRPATCAPVTLWTCKACSPRTPPTATPPSSNTAA